MTLTTEFLNNLEAKMGYEWLSILKDEFEKPYMEKLRKGIAQARARKTIVPSPENVFKAFRLTPFSKVKCVWLAQDPYARREGEANGLAFDCSGVSYTTPSWKYISDVYDEEFPDSFSPHVYDGDLEYWAQEGTLLLNASLTVPIGESGKHLPHWKPFTERVMMELVTNSDHKIVFVAIGKWADEYMGDVFPHHKLKYEHPAYAARQGRKWNAKGIFTEINTILENENQTPISW